MYLIFVWILLKLECVHKFRFKVMLPMTTTTMMMTMYMEIWITKMIAGEWKYSRIKRSSCLFMEKQRKQGGRRADSYGGQYDRYVLYPAYWRFSGIYCRHRQGRKISLLGLPPTLEMEEILSSQKAGKVHNTALFHSKQCSSGNGNFTRQNIWTETFL